MVRGLLFRTQGEGMCRHVPLVEQRHPEDAGFVLPFAMEEVAEGLRAATYLQTVLLVKAGHVRSGLWIIVKIVARHAILHAGLRDDLGQEALNRVAGERCGGRRGTATPSTICGGIMIVVHVLAVLGGVSHLGT